MCKTSRGTERQRPVSIDRRHFMARWQTSYSDTYAARADYHLSFVARHLSRMSLARSPSWMFCSGAERTEKDGLVVCTILGVPFLSCGLREAGLPARVAKNENDRNGVGQIGLLDRGKAFRMVYEPLRLPQEAPCWPSAANASARISCRFLPIRGPAFRRLSERRRPRPPTMRAKRRWATCSTLPVARLKSRYPP